MLIPVEPVEEIVAPSSLLTVTRCAEVLIFRPLPEEAAIFPLLVIVVTLYPETETAFSLPEDDEMVISWLIAYSVSVENVCGTEVDLSIRCSEGHYRCEYK